MDPEQLISENENNNNEHGDLLSTDDMNFDDGFPLRGFPDFAAIRCEESGCS